MDTAKEIRNRYCEGDDIPVPYLIDFIMRREQDIQYLEKDNERLRHVLSTCETRKTGRSMLELYDEIVADGAFHDVWPGTLGE